MRFLLACALFLCVCSAARAAEKKAASPVSHRAAYDLTLTKTAGGALSVVGAEGKMSYSIQKTCKGWQTETVFSLTVAYEISGLETTVWRQQTTESDDGCRFDFSVDTLNADGTQTRETAGSSRCEKGKKRLKISFPLKSEATFPKTVLFPVKQTQFLLEQARKGKKQATSYVYDGSKLESLQKVHAVIGKEQKKAPDAAFSGDKSLTAGNARRFDIAFYNDLGLSPANDGTPMYEVSMLLYDNGVADDILQDFGGYAVRSRLISAERLPDVACR